MSRPNRRFLAAAIGVAAFNILASPFFGLARDALLDLFSFRALLAFAAILVLTLLTVLILGVRRIAGPRRVWRWAALATAASLVLLQTFALGRGNFDVDVVEKFHFLQYGLLAYLVYRAFLPLADVSPWILPPLAALTSGALEEAGQWLSPLRVGEFTDVGLNLFAGIIGTLVAWSFHPTEPGTSGLSTVGRRWCASIALAALLVNAAFVHQVHLGHRLLLEVDDQRGPVAWLSWHTENELLHLRTQRTGQWRRAPFTPRRGFPEDLFASEAGWRVSHRNAALERGDLHVAWAENSILETYFDPFLDQLSPRDGKSHRWSPQQRQDLDRRRPTPPQPPYLSPVLETRVWTQPRRRDLWIAIVPLALVLATVAFGWVGANGAKTGSPRP